MARHQSSTLLNPDTGMSEMVEDDSTGRVLAYIFSTSLYALSPEALVSSAKMHLRTQGTPNSVVSVSLAEYGSRWVRRTPGEAIRAGSPALLALADLLLSVDGAFGSLLALASASGSESEATAWGLIEPEERGRVLGVFLEAGFVESEEEPPHLTKLGRDVVEAMLLDLDTDRGSR